MFISTMVRFSAPVAALAGILLFAAIKSGGEPRPEEVVAETIEIQEDVRDEFGIAGSDLDVTARSIRRNETFAQILTAHNVPYSNVISLVDAARPVFDVRTLRAGQPIHIYTDSLEAAQYVVYQRDAINYVVFDLASDSALVYEGSRPVEVRRRQLAASINSSLYATLDRQGLPAALVPMLATRLSEVFAWQIDFYRIQRGDDFNLVYEERLIDGEPIGIGRIIGARFAHAGRDFFGFLFEEGDRPDFYDEEGNSLRKAFLKAPLEYSRISSPYTQRRFHPVLRQYRPHLGTDYAAPTGTPIRTVGDGVVVEAQFNRNNGNYVKIRHNGTYTTGYLHMSRIAGGIRPGVHVQQGQLIGFVGSTGLATGPHLCYRFWKNGVQVDPFKEEIPPAHPVDPELRDVFISVRDALMPQLLEPPPSRIAGGQSRNQAGAI